MVEGFSLGGVWARFSSSDTLIAAVVTVAIPIIAMAITHWIAPRVKLRYGTMNNLIMLPKKPDGSQGVLKVQRIRVFNSGRKSAENVEVIFNWKPQHIEQYPHIVTSETISSDGRYILLIQRLNGGEWINFSVASDVIADLPSIIYVRASGHKAKPVEYRELIWLPLPLRILVIALFILGAFSAIYGLVLLFGWLLFGRNPF